MRPFISDLMAVSERVSALAQSLGVLVTNRSERTKAAEQRFVDLQAAYEAGHAIHDEVAQSLRDLEVAWTAEVRRAERMKASSAFDSLFEGV